MTLRQRTVLATTHRYNAPVFGVRMYEHFLVRCPRCDQCAEVTGYHPNGENKPYLCIGRLVCPHCGLVSKTQRGAWRSSEPTDQFYKYPLWLQTRCCGHILWAYDLEHLRMITKYIEAIQRPRPKHTVTMRVHTHGHPNAPKEGIYKPHLWKSIATMTARLPRWMVLGNNRLKVQQGLKRLEAKALKA